MILHLIKLMISVKKYIFIFYLLQEKILTKRLLVTDISS